VFNTPDLSTSSDNPFRSDCENPSNLSIRKGNRLASITNKSRIEVVNDRKWIDNLINPYNQVVVSCQWIFFRIIPLKLFPLDFECEDNYLIEKISVSCFTQDDFDHASVRFRF